MTGKAKEDKQVPQERQYFVIKFRIQFICKNCISFSVALSVSLNF